MSGGNGYYRIISTTSQKIMKTVANAKDDASYNAMQCT